MESPRELSAMEDDLIKVFHRYSPFDRDDLKSAYILGGFSLDGLRMYVTMAYTFDLTTASQAAREMRIVR